MLEKIVKRLPPIRRLIAERDMLRDALNKSGSTKGDSDYDNESLIASEVKKGRHREVIGATTTELWDQGNLQFQFLVDHGLKPSHKLLDIGCGSLRGGVHFISYLDPGNYWGVDISASLIEAGWSKELVEADLRARQPRDQLVCLQDFEFNTLNEQFDFAIAQSLFTHLNFNRIRRCLVRLLPVLMPGGKLFATFFEVPAGFSPEEPLSQSSDVDTYSCCDPFHYQMSDFEYAISSLQMQVHYHGDWNHPRNQKMLIFEAN